MSIVLFIFNILGQVFEDSFHQLRMRSAEEMGGRLQVNFHGEEGKYGHVLFVRMLSDEFVMVIMIILESIV